MIDFRTFQLVYGLAVVLLLSGYAGSIALWHAGARRKYSPQRMWARRLWQLLSFLTLILFIWSSLYILQLDH
jgi:hypothetical protein